MACSDCVAWSDQQARIGNHRVMESVCLNPRSPFYQGFTRATDNCSRFEAGRPVDEPNDDERAA